MQKEGNSIAVLSAASELDGNQCCRRWRSSEGRGASLGCSCRRKMMQPRIFPPATHLLHTHSCFMIRKMRVDKRLPLWLLTRHSLLRFCLHMHSYSLTMLTKISYE